MTNKNTTKFTRNDARALVGLGSVLVTLDLMSIKEFTAFMAKTEDWVIEDPDWVSSTFFQMIYQLRGLEG